MISKHETDRHFRIVGAMGGCSIVLVTVYIIFVWVSIARVNTALFSQAEYFRRFEAERNYPSALKEAYLAEQDQGLEQLVEGLRAEPIFWHKIGERNLSLVSPLKFKEELFRVKNVLRQKANAREMILCTDIGFSIWENSLPHEAELENLFQALDIVRDVIDTAIDARIYEIVEVQTMPLEKIVYPDAVEGQFYYQQDVTITLRGTAQSMAAFIYRINMAQTLLHVEHITWGIRLQPEPKDTIGDEEEKETNRGEKEKPEKILIATCTVRATYL